MKFRLSRIAAIVSTMAIAASANAALSTYAPWDTAYTANGLNGVLFNVQSAGGATVALGAHAYKNGAYLPNNGVNTYYAQSGTYAGPPAEANRANWSFDFGWNLGTNCLNCSVWLGIDNDPTSAVNLLWGDITVVPQPESWNLEMPFLAGVNFDPFSPSSTAFSLQVRDATGSVVVGSDITVNVPEPGSLALVGLALGGLALARRRRVG